MWQSEVSTAVVDRIAPRRGERVVEIGSGMGAAVGEAARAGAFVVAVDPTPYMRRVLRLRLLVPLRRGQVRVADGAAESLPVADGSADAVWSVNTMHHWTDPERALREIHRVLRPGGRLLLVDEDFEDPAHPMHAQFHARHGRHDHPFTMVEPGDFAGQLRALGFASAEGGRESIAGRPARMVRGFKA